MTSDCDLQTEQMQRRDTMKMDGTEKGEHHFLYFSYVVYV